MAMMLGGCALSPPPDERLHSTLWVQTSAEYAISTRQVYRLATDALGPALADPDRHGLESPLSAADLPPAIIVDVDETVLDNSGHTARMILARQGFTTESWRAWVREASAPAVPGAVDYLQAAAARGITVFYVTNRHHDLEQETRRNLAAVGCPIETGTDVVLTRQEAPHWGRDKTSRREFVGARYRVLQMVGDDLADFIALPEPIDDEKRVELGERYEDRWGSAWFMIPNPMYGSWERALMQGGVSLFNRPMEEKFEHLETKK
ncbi:MAG: HAD family acid phosphatase [Gammaproteobacteria bacterium]|jgi:acid phosphatase